MTTIKKETVSISPHSLVTVTEMNHIYEIQYMEKMNTSATIKKLDKDRYCDLSTGEIKEFNHIDNRSQSLNSLRQTFKKMRYLINNNFIGKGNELHLILTYAENMTDVERLYLDFDLFFKRLRYEYRNLSKIDYIAIPEPQGRGAWHMHLLLRFNDVETVFIPNNDLAELWGHGFTKTKGLNNIDNIGAYLSAYLSDLELDPKVEVPKNSTDVTVKVVDGQEKKFVKGARLHLYPAGMNIIRKSRGVVYPERTRTDYKSAKKIVGAGTPHYTCSYEIHDDEFSNTISYEQYNIKRHD